MDHSLVGEECVICGGTITAQDEPGEMYDPDGDDESGFVHAECGVAAGWEQA